MIKVRISYTDDKDLKRVIAALKDFRVVNTRKANKHGSIKRESIFLELE